MISSPLVALMTANFNEELPQLSTRTNLLLMKNSNQ